MRNRTRTLATTTAGAAAPEDLRFGADSHSAVRRLLSGPGAELRLALTPIDPAEPSTTVALDYVETTIRYRR